MANPKRRKTHSATHKSRSHLALKKVILSKCPKCGQALKPYTACAACGYYKEREIRRIKMKSAKKKS